MTGLDDDLRKQLDALKQSFLSDLPSRLECIEKSLNECIHNDFAPSSVEAFHRCCHSTAGTSATHQLREISRVARNIEQYIRPYMENPDHSVHPDKVKLATLINELRSAIHNTIHQ